MSPGLSYSSHGLDRIKSCAWSYRHLIYLLILQFYIRVFASYCAVLYPPRRHDRYQDPSQEIDRMKRASPSPPRTPSWSTWGQPSCCANVSGCTVVRSMSVLRQEGQGMMRRNILPSGFLEYPASAIGDLLASTLVEVVAGLLGNGIESWSSGVSRVSLNWQWQAGISHDIIMAGRYTNLYHRSPSVDRRRPVEQHRLVGQTRRRSRHRWQDLGPCS